MSTPIVDVKWRTKAMGTRIRNVMHRLGVETLEQAADLRPSKLLRMKGLGWTGYCEIADQLEAHGISDDF